MKNVCLLIVAVLLLSAVGCGQKTWVWKEQVTLHDGRSIIVKRTATVGGGAREPGARMLGATKLTLDFTTPDGREVHWETPAKLDPMILDFVGNVPYLAASPRMVTDYFKFGCPEPAYVFFKFDGEWRRIGYQEFPTEWRKSNLLMAYYRSDGVLAGFVSAKELAEKNSNYALDDDVKTIKPERHSPYPPCPLVKKQ